MLEVFEKSDPEFNPFIKHAQGIEMKRGDQKDGFLIFRFLRKMLNRAEHDAIKQRLNDESFLDDVSQETVRQYSRFQLKSKLEVIHSEVEKKRHRGCRIKILFIVLLLILLGICGMVYLSNFGSNKSKQPDEIYASYFKPYESLLDTKGKNEAEEEGYQSAMKAYSLEDFAKAAILFESAQNQSVSRGSLYSLYYGNALLADNQSEKAIDVLQKLYDESASKSPIPKEVIQWYLALAYINNSEILEAKLLFENLASQQNGSYKQKESSEILEMLED